MCILHQVERGAKKIAIVVQLLEKKEKLSETYNKVGKAKLVT